MRNMWMRFSRRRRIGIVVGALAFTLVIAAGSVTLSMATSSHGSWQDVSHISVESLAAVPGCGDRVIAAEVVTAVSGSTESLKNSVLISPAAAREMGLSPQVAAAQVKAWDALSDHDRAFQTCLGAEQAQVAK